MCQRRRRRSAWYWALLAITLFQPSLAVLRGADEPPAEKGPEGIWQGTLKTRGVFELRLLFKIEKQPDGTFEAKLDSIDQGAKIAVDEVQCEDGQLTLVMKKIGASFVGKLNESATEMVGEFKQGGQTIPLTLKRLEKEPELARPQEPKGPLPYIVEEVTYENSAAGIKLAGTLTLPRRLKGRLAAVVLITGSGAQDRDESLLGHKPFLVLADHLTRRGIAVLRVDDRGVGGSTGNTSTSTTEDFVGDVLEGVKLLMDRPEVDPSRIGLIGHSEGGLIAPMAAVRSTDVSFIVLMAGTGVAGEEIIYRQGELIIRASGKSDTEVEASRKVQEQCFEVLKQEADPTKAEARLREIMAEALPSDGVDDAAREALKAELESQVRMMQTPWFRFFLSYDPRPALTKVNCPVLALNGEKDLQVDPRQNLPEIEKALKAGGNRQYTMKEFPSLNHLFQTCQTGSPAEYGKIDETIAPVVLDTIADWIIEPMRPTE